MAVRRLQDGTWEFDSVAEAVEFERQFAPTGSAAQPNNSAPSVPARPRYEPFYRSLAVEYRRLIDALVVADRPLNTNDLVEECQMRRTSFPPLLRHLRDTAREYGLGDEFLRKRSMQVKPNDKKRASYHELSGEAKEALRSLVPESVRAAASKTTTTGEDDQEDGNPG